MSYGSIGHDISRQGGLKLVFTEGAQRFPSVNNGVLA
jgi:hypothetical protein